MHESKPIFKRENLLYERKEKEGYWSFLSKLHPETRELIVNPTGMEILTLCDGVKTLQEIEDVMKNKYPNVDSKIIKMDVAKTIANFSRLGIIEWDGDNPFLFRKEEPISDKLFMRIGQEEDIIRMKEFIENSGICGVREYNNSDILIKYICPFTHPSEYKEIPLRQKLFMYVSEFFLLVHKDEIQGIIEISAPALPNKTAALVKLLVLPGDLVSTLLRYSQDYYPMLSIAKEVTKITLLESLKNPLDLEFRKILTDEGYHEEGILVNEVGFGNDVRIMSRSYNQAFVKKISERRERVPKFIGENRERR